MEILEELNLFLIEAGLAWKVQACANDSVVIRSDYARELLFKIFYVRATAD